MEIKSKEINNYFYGDFIKKERIKLGLSQKDLALKLSLSFQAISKYEKGEVNIDISLIGKLSKIFHIDVESFIKKEEKWNNDLSIKYEFNEKRFAYSLKYLREKHMISQKDLAKEVDISQFRINKIENNTSLIRLDEFIKLANYFNIDISHFYYGINDKNNELNNSINSISNSNNIINKNTINNSNPPIKSPIYKKYPYLISLFSFLLIGLLLSSVILPTSIYLNNKNNNESYIKYSYEFNDDGIVIKGIDYLNSKNIDKLDSLYIPSFIDNYKVIGIKENSFTNLENIKNVVIEENIEYIEDYAFNNLVNLTSIYLPSSLSIYYNFAFNNIPNLKSIEVDENNPHFKSLNNDLYSKDLKRLYKVSLKKDNEEYEYNLLNGVEVISSNAFDSLANLVKINFSSSLKKVDSNAFMNLKDLKEVNFNEGLLFLDFASFLNCNNKDFDYIYLPSSLTTINEGNPFLHMPNLKNIEVDKYNKSFMMKDNLLLSKDLSSLYFYIENEYSLAKEKIPPFINTIYSGAINSLSNVDSLVLPSSISLLDNYSIQNNTSLKSIYIEEGASNFLNEAITNCFNLSVYLEENSLPSSFSKDFYNGEIVYGIDIPY